MQIQTWLAPALPQSSLIPPTEVLPAEQPADSAPLVLRSGRSAWAAPLLSPAQLPLPINPAFFPGSASSFPVALRVRSPSLRPLSQPARQLNLHCRRLAATRSLPTLLPLPQHPVLPCSNHGLQVPGSAAPHRQRRRVPQPASPASFRTQAACPPNQSSALPVSAEFLRQSSRPVPLPCASQTPSAARSQPRRSSRRLPMQARPP